METKRPWWKELTPYHWFVFTMAALAWLFDCLDQQIFLLFRNTALEDLLPKGTDPAQVKKYGTWATSIFVAGWAIGGLIFGSVGDKIGRAKALTITVLMYSVFTGLSALSIHWYDFAAYRFLTGMGVGGVFGLAVALVADTLPNHARTPALGLLQALSAIGNISAGLISMKLGSMIEAESITKSEAWKFAFLVGAVPAFLCVFIALKLKEPEKWVKARDEGRISGVKLGSYSELLGPGRWRRNAMLGMLLCISGVIGLWGLGFFAPELVGDVIKNSLQGQGLAQSVVDSKLTWYKGVNGIYQNIGAFFGMLGFAFFAQKIGRKPTFILTFLGALIATNFYFLKFNGPGDVWMSSVMGFFQLALFAGFAVYLPELFPTRLRATGTSFCYNVGRLIAAVGPLFLGGLTVNLTNSALAKLPETADAATKAIAKTDAFRHACSWCSVIFLLGIVVIFFMPETKGKPLPEEQAEPA